MKKIYLLLFCGLNLFANLGTANLININSLEIDKAPAGYKPFFINLLSRHSARYLTSEDKILKAINFLKDHKSDLNQNGIKLLKILNSIKDKQDYGKITPLGVSLEKRLGSEFYTKFKDNIFLNNKKILAYNTSVFRTKQSLDAFLSSFKNVEIIFYGIDDENLRFFKKYKTPVSVKKYLLDQNITFNIFNKKLDQKDINKFGSDLFLIYANKESSGFGGCIDKFLNKKDIKILSNYKNLKTYNQNFSNKFMAFKLLSNFLQTSNEAIKDPKIAGIFRFAHAETLLPFINIISGSKFVFTSNSEIINKFNPSSLAPMAGYVAWIFYKNKDDDILVQMILNQKTYKFPFKCKYKNFCSFKKIKSYYDEILKEANN